MAKLWRVLPFVSHPRLKSQDISEAGSATPSSLNGDVRDVTNSWPWNKVCTWCVHVRNIKHLRWETSGLRTTLFPTGPSEWVLPNLRFTWRRRHKIFLWGFNLERSTKYSNNSPRLQNLLKLNWLEADNKHNFNYVSSRFAHPHLRLGLLLNPLNTELNPICQ